MSNFEGLYEVKADSTSQSLKQDSDLLQNSPNQSVIPTSTQIAHIQDTINTDDQSSQEQNTNQQQKQDEEIEDDQENQQSQNQRKNQEQIDLDIDDKFDEEFKNFEQDSSQQPIILQEIEDKLNYQNEDLQQDLQIVKEENEKEEGNEQSLNQKKNKKQIELEIDDKFNEEYNKFEQDSALQPIQPINLDQLKEIEEVINSQLDANQASFDLIDQLTDALFAVRSVQTGDQDQISDEMIDIAESVVLNVAKIAHEIICEVEDVDLAIQSDFIVELVDLINRTPSDQIQIELISAIYKFSLIGSIEQTDKMYEIGSIQALSSKLINQDMKILKYILRTIFNIVKNGWKKTNQSYPQEQLLSPSQTSLTTFPTELQQLLVIPHPYHSDLEGNGVIRSLLEGVLMNQDVSNLDKLEVYKILDTLCIVGIRIPDDLQQPIISELSELIVSDDESNQKYSSLALSYLSINKCMIVYK
ncbi:MAG: hypothetical protein EZS28_027740 [Streblomastix strix]|uniref:Uncharacterized protein n=1 Tax=Streblomastix strix TaxID=222440 RepID=A0A5J4V2R0_9EUKA|nr:MAG: hypothetical protein EZS28_027740 [Streblomastix strix]